MGDNTLQEEFVYIGPRKVAVWPKDQKVYAVDAGIWSTRFTDTDAYHPVLTRRVLEAEEVLRRESPPTRWRGGQEIRDLESCCRIEQGHMTNPLYPELTTGTPMLFPGILLHEVSAYSGRRPRITIAWNINETELPGSTRDPVQFRPGFEPAR